MVVLEKGTESSCLPTEPCTESGGAWPCRWQHGEEAGHREAAGGGLWSTALELVFGPRGAQVTRGVCGMRPDPAEGGLGLSVLSLQPWDSRPRVNPALGGAAASPQDQTGGSHSSEGRVKGLPRQA